MIYAAGFLGCAIVIFFAGQRLSYYGDLMAEHTGLGKAWIGLILMASVTSLPELMVGISSSAIVQSADLAVGDILGSCAFNLGILAMLDMFIPRQQSLFLVASPRHILIAALSIILVTMVGVAIVLPGDIIISSWIGLSSLSFIAIYFLSIRLIYLNELRGKSDVTGAVVADPGRRNPSLVTTIRYYIFFAVIIIAAALAIPYFADRLAAETGLGRTFVGTFFLAASTSLPEIAVSIAAVRMGSIDLSIGNLLGSNIFNILILAIDDIFYTRGHILKDAASFQVISVFSVIIMTAVVIIGLSFPSRGKRFKLAWDAGLIFMIYVINMILLYRLTS